MKNLAIRRIRQKLAADEPVYGLWVTLASASVTEMGVALGLDWLVIDAEHGHLNWRDLLEHIRAAARSNTVVLVRVAELNIGLIKRSLDIGADGVVVPLAEPVEELRQAVAVARHYAGVEHAARWEHRFVEHVRKAHQRQGLMVHKVHQSQRLVARNEAIKKPKENVLVVPIIEAMQEVHNIHEIFNVPEVEIFFFSPANYLATADFSDKWEESDVAKQILAAKDAIRAQGKHCGMVAMSNDNLAQLREQGFRMLGIGCDTGLLRRSIREALSNNPLPPFIKKDGRDNPSLRSRAGYVKPTFTLENDSETEATVKPLSCVPEAMRPDRPAVMNPVGSGVKSKMAPGVVFECLVGPHNNARNLTTGIATFEPGAKLPYYNLPCSESITLLSGQAIVAVEERMYTLEPLDNVTIPEGIAHATWNGSSNEPAVFHIALSAENPNRTLVKRFFSRKMMPVEQSKILNFRGLPQGRLDAIGKATKVQQEGSELITRHKTATRYEAGPNTAFIDFFNNKLAPGIKMSGGYGLFHHRGRLPAHAHNFDESITIVQGVGTCVVEGQRHTLSDNATALQPRGRCHYFINERHEPMVMIWVYAGPLPERVVVDERCATVGVITK
ncbi:cupin domain-containing protein [Candidatus Poribacteria bacterium]|nr:cupin domain-containing protein [Candidatus Poribacteria bacterium]